MALQIYDNTIGFRPTGFVLKTWVLLPQVTTSVGGEKIPSLYGNLKSIMIPFLMFILLIIAEGVLMLQLNEEGVGFLTLLGLSIFDFVIAFLPAILYWMMDLYPEVIKTNIFILNQKLKIPHPIDEQFETREKYNDSLKEDLKTWNSKLSSVFFLNLFFAFIIIGFSIWKFIIYYEIFGADIFIESIGRFILIVILLSVITHLLFTKTVFVYTLFKIAINKQLADLRRHENASDYHVTGGEINKHHEVKYEVKYKPAFSGNQRLAQMVSMDYTPTANEKIIELEHDDIKHKYRVSEFTDNKKIYIVSTAILTDPEIQGLYTNQDAATKKAVIASCKEIQIAY